MKELSILRNEIGSLRLSKVRETDEALWMSARIVETVPDGITITDCAGKIIFANVAAEKILGLTKIHLTRRLYNSPSWKITAVDGQPFKEDKLPFNMVIKKGCKFYSVEYAIQHSDGRRVILSVLSSPVHDSAGNLIGMISSITDVTDRWKNEEMLELTKFSVDRSAVPTYWIGAGAEFMHVNDAACEMLGYSREELLKMTVHDIDPDYKKSIWGKHWADLKNQKKLIFESRHRKKDGSILTMEINANYLEFRGREYNFAFALDITERKKADAALGIFRDIAAHKEYKRQLREREQAYRNIFETFYDVYFEIDTTGRIINVSPSIYARSGYTAGEFINHHIGEFFLEKDINAFFEKIKREKIVSGYETTFMRKDKKILDISVDSRFVFDEKKNTAAIEGIIRDITEKKKVEAENNQIFESLKKSLEGIVKALAVTSETRDPYTAGHQRRVSKLSCEIAREMGLSNTQIECIEIAGLLHDLGKISIPSALLTKKEPLTKDDFKLIRTHSKTGYEILKNIEFPWPIAPVVLQHHERLNGRGYPMQLTGDSIMLEAKIISVADVVEAISFKRPYRPALGVDEAIDELLKYKSILYDINVVDACIKVLRSGDFEFDKE